jgi:hypothetical protein
VCHLRARLEPLIGNPVERAGDLTDHFPLGGPSSSGAVLVNSKHEIAGIRDTVGKSRLPNYPTDKQVTTPFFGIYPNLS